MIIPRFLLLFFAYYIASNQWGLSLLNAAAPNPVSPEGRWVLNEAIGALTSFLFALLWTWKTHEDIRHKPK